MEAFLRIWQEPPVHLPLLMLEGMKIQALSVKVKLDEILKVQVISINLPMAVRCDRQRVLMDVKKFRQIGKLILREPPKILKGSVGFSALLLYERAFRFVFFFKLLNYILWLNRTSTGAKDSYISNLQANYPDPSSCYNTRSYSTLLLLSLDLDSYL